MPLSLRSPCTTQSVTYIWPAYRAQNAGRFTSVRPPSIWRCREASHRRERSAMKNVSELTSTHRGACQGSFLMVPMSRSCSAEAMAPVGASEQKPCSRHLSRRNCCFSNKNGSRSRPDDVWMQCVIDAGCSAWCGAPTKCMNPDPDMYADYHTVVLRASRYLPIQLYGPCCMHACTGGIGQHQHQHLHMFHHLCRPGLSEKQAWTVQPFGACMCRLLEISSAGAEYITPGLTLL